MQPVSTSIYKTKATDKPSLLFVLALPIFPGRLQPSIVGAGELNCRVRNGNGWTLTAISTNFNYYTQHTLVCQAFSRTYFRSSFYDPYRIRTDVNGVRGRCLNHLTNGPNYTFRDSNPGHPD